MTDKSGSSDPKPPDDHGDDGDDSGPRSFVTALSDNAKWAVGGIAAAGSAAVTAFGLSKIGKGVVTEPPSSWHDWPLGLVFALLGAVLFAVGASATALLVVWLFRSSRVSMEFLRSTRGMGCDIRGDIERDMPYLLVGCTSLADFVDAYKAIAGGPDTPRARQLKAARYAILDTASAERMQRLTPPVLCWIAFAVAVAVIGAVLFSYVGNVAENARADFVLAQSQAREDELRELATGALLPHTPASISLVIPTDIPNDDPWVQAVGETCARGVATSPPSGATSPTPDAVAPRSIPATLIEAGHPSTDSEPIATVGNPVFRVVTSKTPECRDIVIGWVPPEWVVVPAGPNASSAAAAPASKPAPTSATQSSPP